MKLKPASNEYMDAIKSIASEYGVDAGALARGVNVEFEHGKEAGELDITHDDIIATAKIALVHIKENPEYYDKLKKIEKINAKQYAGRFFCKHMRSGIAGGYEGNERLFINDDGIKALSPTFEGKPVYVGHQEVSLTNLQAEADGYVVKSFYNEKDGWWWAEFIAVSDKAHEAIRSGCGVSNAYVPTEYAEGDQHIGVDYDARVLNGYFTHLAIVPNPRYEESVILTPEQFREYQDKKTSELRNVTNSKTIKGVNVMSLFGKIFKTEKVEVTNALPADADYSAYSVEIDGKTHNLSEVINAVKNMDKAESKEEKEEKLNEDSKISYDGKETTLGELMNRYKSGSKKNAVKKNEDDTDEDDVANGDDFDEDDKEEKKNKGEKKNSHFNDLKNADKVLVVENSTEIMEGQAQRLARSKRLMSV